MFKVSDLKLGRASWVKVANIKSSRLGWTLDDCVDSFPVDLQKIRSWMDAVKKGAVIKADGKPTSGSGLLFIGQPGHGKTTLAVACIQEMLTQFPLDAFAPPSNASLVRPCYFSTFNELIELRGSMMEEHTDQQEALYYGMLGECENDAYNIRVLVIDDVGREHTSDSGWQKSLLHDVIRTRHNNGLPTIVTSNIDLKGWAGKYGDATASFAKEAFGIMQIESSKGDLRQ
jgi:DNA replication protein DnaC